MKKIARSQFHLRKVKRGDKGGLVIAFDYEMGGNSEIDRIKVKDFESTVEPHPDLTSRIRALLPMLVRTKHYGVLRDIAGESKFAATKKQAEFLEKAYQAIVEKVTATGIAISGTDKIGVVITGKIETDGGMKSAMNTPRLQLDREVFGFEGELDTLVEELEEEVYNYLYENKKSQLSLFEEHDHEHAEVDENEQSK